MAAYENSALCRYLEEAHAETYAQVKVNGLSALPEGLSFPVAEEYVTVSASPLRARLEPSPMAASSTIFTPRSRIESHD